MFDCMVSQTVGSGRGADGARAGRGVEPAPVSAAGVADALRPFGQSRMLPRAAYVDPAVFAWEQRHFFGGGWLCVGRSDQLPDPGDQRAEASTAGGVLLVRGEDGALRAFANACRHRGHELLPCGQTANARAIVCPYHAWAFSLDGGLRAAAGFRHQPGFHDADWGLAELPVTEWHGLVFVDGSGTAGPLDAALSELDAIVAPYEPERLVVAGRHEYETSANWKILTENYHECYHCPAIHPELCKVSPPKSGENYTPAGPWVGGWMDLRDGMDTMSLDGTSGGVTLRGLDERRRRTVEYVNVFPNILISAHPDYVMVHRLLPLAADRTWIECTWSLPRRRWNGPASTRGTRWTSGTSPTGRTGRRASRSSGACPPRTRGPARCHRTRTASTSSSPGWRAGTRASRYGTRAR